MAQLLTWMADNASMGKRELKRQLKQQAKRVRGNVVEYYRNPLTFPYMLASTLLFVPLLYVPIAFLAVDHVPPWLVTVVVFGYIGGSTALAMRSAFHFHWYVGRDSLRSVQTGKGGAITHHFLNLNFVSIAVRGPFVVVRCASGERHVWPRWLRRERKTYRWQLRDGSLQLHAPEP